MKFDKRSCLNRAEQMLASGDESLLRYVSLELRFCMEAIVYAKLGTYASRLPKKVLSKWQPPQAMRALLAIEPRATENFELAFSWESSPGVPDGKAINLGRHTSIDPGWLRKHYNKLGNLLHVPSSSSESSNRSPEKIREYLQSVIAELGPVVASRIDSSLATTLEFECSQCHEPVICNYAGALENKRATCLNPNCEAEHLVVEENGSITFHLAAVLFTCRKCEGKMPVENRKLELGLCFKCPQCGAEWKIVGRQWACKPVEE